MIKKVLAIDFGLKRIGLATNCDFLAEPLKIIDSSNQDQAIKEIVKICQLNQIEKIVIGISEQDMAKRTYQFGQKLSEKLLLPIIYYDETLSTTRVIQKLKLRGKRIPRYIDHYAAAFILEEWLSSLHN